MTTNAHRRRDDRFLATARAERHRAILDSDARGPFVRVKSSSVDGKAFRVTAVAVDGPGTPVLFHCHPIGTAAFRDDHLHTSTAPGHVPCKHAAVAARRLVREGLAVDTGAEFVAAGEPATPPEVDVDEAFAGIPRQ